MFTLMELVQPQSLEEAYEILMKRKNNIVIGGSAFLRMGEKRIGTGIDLSNLNLNLIEETSDYIKIGAMTTLRDLEVSPILNKYFNGVIGNCVKDIIGVQFRNVVTVGASVFSKYGFSDLIVALLSLDTEVELYKGGRVKLEEFLNQKYGERTVLVDVEDSYYNMNDIISDHPEILERAQMAFRKVGIEPVMSSIRGGTDGARLSFEGLPCPNLSTGGMNFHSIYEAVSVEALEKMTDVLVEIVLAE